MPQSQPITITMDGKEYQGTYTISSGKHPMISVTSTYGQKTTQVGNTPVDNLARLLLSELVFQNKDKPR